MLAPRWALNLPIVGSDPGAVWVKDVAVLGHGLCRFARSVEDQLGNQVIGERGVAHVRGSVEFGVLDIEVLAPVAQSRLQLRVRAAACDSQGASGVPNGCAAAESRGHQLVGAWWTIAKSRRALSARVEQPCGTRRGVVAAAPGVCAGRLRGMVESGRECDDVREDLDECLSGGVHGSGFDCTTQYLGATTTHQYRRLPGRF